MKRLKRVFFLVVVCSHLFTQAVEASDGAEVFDINKGEIILTIPNSNSLQEQIREWLNAVNGTVVSFAIEPSEGIAIKIPLTPPYKINTEWITGTVTEVVMFISSSKTYFPTLLIFTKEHEVIAVHFKSSSLKAFLKQNKLYNSKFNLADPSQR